MYTIKFRVPSVTKGKVHTVEITDNSLEDTWQHITLSEISPDLLAAGCDGSHDFNVYVSDEGLDRDELVAVVYPLEICKNGKVGTRSLDKAVKVVIVSVVCKESPNEFVEEDGHFLYNEDNDKIECPICERACYEHDLNTNAKGVVTSCTDCFKEQVTTPLKLRVPIAKWYQMRYNRPWDYHSFINTSGDEIARPDVTAYEVGDVITCTIPGNHAVGVVLGVIDNVSEELRTDIGGMIGFDSIRPATMEDVKADPSPTMSILLKFLSK